LNEAPTIGKVSGEGMPVAKLTESGIALAANESLLKK